VHIHNSTFLLRFSVHEISSNFQVIVTYKLQLPITYKKTYIYSENYEPQKESGRYSMMSHIHLTLLQLNHVLVEVVGGGTLTKHFGYILIN
jgi:hypothetical protein